MPSLPNETNVQVAVRVRPQSSSEINEGLKKCTAVNPEESQIAIGSDKLFTFDLVFDIEAKQGEIFDKSVANLVDGTLHGYNATILAYGQTGSGKTYTMGTAWNESPTNENTGIIPRAVNRLFDQILNSKLESEEKGITPPDFKISAQFLELYNEDMNDLLMPADKTGAKGLIKIHGEGSMIYVSGASTRPVNNVEDCLKCLEIGSLNRVTASTNMNATSSRSHAIFTITVKQQRVLKNEDETAEKELQSDSLDFETLTAKFHFVDLAGSERLKRTGATGDRAKEGIAINCGLLALGNVISALGDATKRGSHVPYRNSKLTRLLQDSLGGNSRTMMIACVSPSDRDFMETLNTLVYANRAKNIKNKPSVNQDKASKQISDLKNRIAELESELLKYKQGKLTADVCFMNDMSDENRLLLREQDSLRDKIKTLQATIESKTQEISVLKTERDLSRVRSSNSGSNSENSVDDLIAQYMSEMESVKSKVTELEIENSKYRKEIANLKTEFPIQNKSRSLLSTSKSVSRPNKSSVRNAEPSVSIPPIDVSSYEKDLSELIAQAEADLAEKKEVLATSRTNQTSGDVTTTRPERRKRNKVSSGKEKSSEKRASSVSCDERSNAETLSEISELKSSIEDENENDDENNSGNETSDNDESDLENDDSEDLRVADIAYITQEISVKEKLILQLEKSQVALNNMKQGYDQKFRELQMKMNSMEEAKQNDMKNADGSQKSGEDLEKIKKEYKQKVSNLEKEMKKLKSFEKVNKQHMNELKRNEERILSLKTDVEKMRDDKAKLVRQMKEESKRHREKEQTQRKEVAQLKKQERLKDNKIKSLEIENQQKNVILQRKLQEMDVLRKTKKGEMSDKAAGRVTKSRSESRKANDKTINSTANSSKYGKTLENKIDQSEKSLATRNNSTFRSRKRSSLTASKLNWEKFSTMMESHVENCYSVAYLEKEMEDHMKERERWNSEKQILAKKITSAKLLKDSKKLNHLLEELEVVKCSIEEAQERIEEKQAAIVTLNSATENSKFAQIDVESMDVKHCKSLLQQLLTFTVERSVQLKEDQAKIRELEAQIGEEEINKTIQQQLLDFVILDDDDGGSDTRIRLAASPVQEQMNCTFIKDAPDLVQSATMSEQHQQHQRVPSPMGFSLPETVTTRRRGNKSARFQSDESNLNQTSESSSQATGQSISASETFLVSGTPLMDKFGIKLLSNEDLSTLPESPRKEATSNTNNSSRRSSGDSGENGNLSRSNSFRLGAARSDNSDVFTRLLKSVPRVDLHGENKTEVGTINGYRGAIAGAANFPLKCHHVAEGHKKGVVSVDATETHLFTGSLDRTVKVWDLNEGGELLSITGFPHSVLQVKYHKSRNLLFAASLHVIKVLDPLQKNSDPGCLKTLKSSGGSYERLDYPSAQTTKIPQGEDQINDVAFSSCGNLLYSVSRNFIRIWDLRHLPGALKSIQLVPSQSHSAAINVLAVKNCTKGGPDLVFTGSRDHSVKCCEAILELEGICRSLEPPHFDGVESMCIYNNWLYSSGRDSCIKQWDVSSIETCHNVASVSSAHNHWITALTMFPNVAASHDSGSVPYLVSGCRSGEMKVWDCEKLKLLGELKAHKAHVHAFASNSNCLFSASGDWDVKIWRL